MKKTFTAAQIREMAMPLFTSWEETKNEIKLSGKSLYSLISLKKQIEQKLTVIEETLASLAMQYDGVPQGDGSIVIPPEKRADANKAFNELGQEEIELESSIITIRNEDVLPVSIYEAIFDFIVFED